MNLKQLIRRSVCNQPHQTAIIDGDLSVRYEELFSLIQLIAVDLRAYGINRGDRVGLCFPNSISYVAMTFAIWEVEAVVVPIGKELKPAEVENIRATIQLDAVIHDGPGTASFVQTMGDHELRYTIDRQPACGPRQPIMADAAFIRFTSGTTGKSKGVVLTHTKIGERIQTLNQTLAIHSGDTILWLLSMAHHFVSTILLYLAENATIVIVNQMLAGPILRIANAVQATVLYAAPFHYSLLAADSSDARLPTVRLALSTTIGLPDTVYSAFTRRFGLSPAQAYGIIEVGIVCINMENPSHKPGSVGRVVDGYRMCLRNVDRYSAGEHRCGELWLKGPGFFDAYFHPWQAADEVLDDGWFDTGDIGRIDPDGFVYLVSRKKDVINLAGMKVFPQEIEDVINQHPAVKESVVYGRKHERFGEVIVADVVLRKTENSEIKREIPAFCRKRLAAYKIPEEIRVVTNIQKTPVTAKIKRRA